MHVKDAIGTEQSVML